MSATQQAAAFLAAFEASVRAASPRSINETPEVLSSRIHGVLVASAWCSMLVLRGQLTEQMWLELALVALRAARERQAMFDGKETLQ